MNCGRCGNLIEPERLNILPNTLICSKCARLRNVKKVKGAMIWSHKTAPTIQIMSEDLFNEDWKKYNPTFGRGSGVHRMSPRTAGTA